MACISLYEGKASPRVDTVLHKQNVCEMEAEKNEMKTLCYIRPLSFFSHQLFLSEVRSVSLTKKSRCQDYSVQHLFEKLLLEKNILKATIQEVGSWKNPMSLVPTLSALQLCLEDHFTTQR